MKAINKARQAEIDTAAAACREAATALNNAVADYNTGLKDLKAPVEGAVTEFNEKLTELREIYRGIGEEARDYYENRSERWQESDAGTDYLEWVEALEAAEFDDDVEIEFPDELDELDLRSYEDPDDFPPDEPQS